MGMTFVRDVTWCGCHLMTLLPDDNIVNCIVVVVVSEYTS